VSAVFEERRGVWLCPCPAIRSALKEAKLGSSLDAFGAPPNEPSSIVERNLEVGELWCWRKVLGH